RLLKERRLSGKLPYSRNYNTFIKIEMKYLMLLFICFLSIGVFAQGTDRDKRMINDANELGKAMINNDYDIVIKYTYPLVVENIGGAEQMNKILVNGTQQMEEQGIKFLNCKIGKPSKIFAAGDELHSLLPQKIKMKVTGGTLIARSYLLAISQDNGEN